MKQVLSFFFTFLFFLSYSQNITVDSQAYTPQQLIEEVLMDSNCISNVTVTNAVGGNFNNDLSYGYFDATGTTFPFQSGIVLSTGKLSNTVGPNTSLSDDNAPNWGGDNDLEIILNETNTLNATILEFEFSSPATQVSFRYLFASEEYQENNASSCQYSDLFGFLIKPITDTQYQNIALVPNTNTPVKVTTVTPGVIGSCPPENEPYFGQYNGTNSPINFNGQTAILTATANITPNTTYHVKLVIADEHNYRYDSAVFLEANSFQLSTDLGANKLISTSNALCEGETLVLNINEPNAQSYNWYKDNVLVQSCTDCETFTITEAGTYNVEVGLSTNCVSYGEVVIEYAPIPEVQNFTLTECDLNQDGLTIYNLFDAENDLTNNDTNLTVFNFYYTQADALANTNAITNPTSFENTMPLQTVFARVVNSANCFDIAELQLQTTNNPLIIPDLEACDGEIIDGIASFTLSNIEASILSQIPTNADFTYYETELDAFNDTNALPNTYENSIVNSQTIYVKVENNNQCFSISTVNLIVLYTPILEPDETFKYCLNTFPETITLYGGVLNDLPNNYLYQWLFNGATTNTTTTFNTINEAGIYTVIVTDPNGCSASRTLTVNPSETATIETINVQGTAPNNVVTITVTGEGDYEFAIDNANGLYQDSNIFTNVTKGFHTVFVRNKNECGIVEKEFSVLGFPRFFTPNGDSAHKTWRVFGSNNQFNLIESIKIFNRYGKLITTQKTATTGWDGTHKGNALPSDDYWYVVQFLNGETYTGHFALRR